MGYLVAPVLVLAAWTLIGCGTLIATLAPARQVIGAGLLLIAVVAFPLVPGLGAAAGEDPYTRHARHDEVLSARFEAVRAAAKRGDLSPERTVLVTSMEYWRYGFRHVSHYLPEFTTVQLMIDPFFRVTTAQTPYLVSHDRQLRAAGPSELVLASLLPGGQLDHVVYMIPGDADRFIDPGCLDHAALLPTSRGDLVVIRASANAIPRIEEQRLVCAVAP